MLQPPSTVMLFAFGIGVGLCVLGATLVWRSQLTRKWHSTIGKVVSARRRVSGGGGDRGWTYELTYRYRVDGVSYESSCISLLHKPWLLVSEAEADFFVQRHPSGKEVSVHYDPRAPSRAVLEHRFSLTGVALVILGASVVLAGFLTMEIA